jgi:hypothetical protein
MAQGLSPPEKAPDFYCAKCRGPVTIEADPGLGTVARCGLCRRVVPLRPDTKAGAR